MSKYYNGWYTHSDGKMYRYSEEVYMLMKINDNQKLIASLLQELVKEIKNKKDKTRNNK